MRFRKLRIAFSAVCGIACVLLFALWVRSYWQHDYLYQFNSNLYTGIESDWGIVSFKQLDFRVFPSRRHAIEAWTLAVIPPSAPDTNQHRFQWVWANMTGMLQVVVPHWFLVVSTATLATVPWVRRFNLRTLLIVMTLVAAVLGLVVYATKE